MKPHFLAPLAAMLSMVPASGSTLMLDFGPTAVTGTSLTNSPYHTVAGAGFTDSSWNQITTADLPSAIFSNGDAAAGITLNLGAAPQDSTVVNYATQPSNSNALGNAMGSNNIYTSPSVGRDGIFGLYAQSLGLQVTGLSAGIYEIFIIGRNTNISSSVVHSYAGVGTAGQNFDFSGLTPVTINYTNLTSTAAWIEGTNYTKHTVTVGEGQALNIATQGTGVENRGFMNAIQIVRQVPEPSVAVFAGGVLLPLLRRKRA
ncbi:hypothetical protein OVA24_16425 [Luteolibacter sp. SL250]|uniref:hypothetical protein n=1 Tax=Luteolibacter sp. SL250 TaxID=2995170 RepID=UPI0022717FA7|nr:hypothetical protein [Luteolibacter sp. SL250]WAC18817.1 hypothetical protein OVA24_16425 [Luteolibacter sp. SL250]